MAIDGTWKFEISSPMGSQKGTVEFKVEGGKLSGLLKTPMGPAPVEGSVDGNRATWKSSVTSPMAMTFEFDVTVDGDSLAGTVNTEGFGRFQVKGVRT